MGHVDEASLKRILEAALLSAGRPLSISDLERLFGGDSEPPPRDSIRRGLAALAEDWADRSLALQEVASGFRAQVRDEFEPWVARLWEEKPPRYSRALLETLAIIAYRQPITRSEIEEIRGVSVSTQIMRTLHEREWVRVVGHREAPGKPAMYGTTRQFLDYFNLRTLDQLPPLSEIREMDGRYPELEFEGEPSGAPAVVGQDGDAASGGTAEVESGAEPEAAAAESRAAAPEEAEPAPDGPVGDEDAERANWPAVEPASGEAGHDREGE